LIGVPPETGEYLPYIRRCSRALLGKGVRDVAGGSKVTMPVIPILLLGEQVQK